MAVIAYIGFGANLGDPRAMFAAAKEEISGIPLTTFRRSSSLYETEPVNLSDGGPTFLNAVIEVETNLSPVELISETRKVERKLGKPETHSSDKSRVLDLDLLLFGDIIFDNGDLQIPHPRMTQRAFVLAPLAEIAKEARHPALDKTVGDLLTLLPDEELNGVRIASRNRP
jgi:2-amino-4-hydroxy-6-hydroxymethyldihydropteridine diphosphokinase